MASQNLVINELLAVIQNALKDSDLDHDRIVNTCENNFTAEEIKKANTLLLHLLGKDQKPSLQGPFQNLLDIIDLFNKTAVADMPVFVAKRLRKLPLLLFERSSIQNLVMEIHFLKATLAEMQTKLVAASHNVNLLCDKVYAMQSAEIKQCSSKGLSSKNTDVKSASNDAKLGDSPRAAPRTSLVGKATESNILDLSELDLEVDKDGFVRVKTKNSSHLVYRRRPLSSLITNNIGTQD